MKEHFFLQYKMLNRKLIDFGIPLLFAYSIIPIAFFLLSNKFFSLTKFAPYMYILISLGAISKLNLPKRNNFLKYIFNTNYVKLRILENLICSLPFLIFLSYKGLFLFVIGLLILACFMTLFKFGINNNFTIPTPFGKTPFEFTVGFRKTFYMFIIAYFLTFMSVSANNFNLGIFSIILVSLTCLSYYFKPENEYFVWNFNMSSKQFLIEKIKNCFISFTILTAPIMITMIVFFFKDSLLLISFFFLCFIYLATNILVKYSTYPHVISLYKGILFFCSIFFPPILIGIILYCYKQSIKNLNPFLND